MMLTVIFEKVWIQDIDLRFLRAKTEQCFKTQKNFGLAVGLKHTEVSRIFCGKGGSVSRDLLEKMEQALGLDRGALIIDRKHLLLRESNYYQRDLHDRSDKHDISFVLLLLANAATFFRDDIDPDIKQGVLRFCDLDALIDRLDSLGEDDIQRRLTVVNKHVLFVWGKDYQILRVADLIKEVYPKVYEEHCKEYPTPEQIERQQAEQRQREEAERQAELERHHARIASLTERFAFCAKLDPKSPTFEQDKRFLAHLRRRGFDPKRFLKDFLENHYTVQGTRKICQDVGMDPNGAMGD